MVGIREIPHDLVERVESGTGVDRVVDGVIYDFLSTGLSVSAEHIVVHTSPDPKWLPRYTASLDTVVSLIEQKLPGWRCRLTVHEGGSEGTVAYAGLKRADGVSASPARALLAAFLRALQEARTLADAHSKNPPEAEHG